MTAPVQSTDATFQGDDTNWPVFSAGRLAVAGILAIGGLIPLLEVVSFLFPGLSEDPRTSLRWWLAGILIGVSGLVVVWPWVQVAKRRIERYSLLKETAAHQRDEIIRLEAIVESIRQQEIEADALIESLREELESTRELTTQFEQVEAQNRYLSQLIASCSDVLSLLEMVAIAGAVAIDDEGVALALISDEVVQLAAGDEVVVVDSRTGTPLGLFLCSHALVGAAWAAQEVQIFDSLWWSHMRMTVISRSIPESQVVAIIYRRKVGQHD